MYIFSQVAVPFIWVLRLLAEFFRNLSVGCFWMYDKLIAASLWLNDLTEADVWKRD